MVELLVIMGAAGVAAAIILVVDVVAVLRGGYSMFTPPWVIELDQHIKSFQALCDAVGKKREFD